MMTTTQQHALQHLDLFHHTALARSTFGRGHISLFRKGDNLAGDVVGFSEGHTFAHKIVCEVWLP